MTASAAAQRRRILFLNHVSAISGAEASLLETLRALDRARFEIAVAVPGPGPLADRLAAEKIPVFFLPLRRLRKTWNPFALLAALVNVLGVGLRLARLIRRERFELVHANSTTAQIYGGLAAGWADVPSVWHCRDLVELGPLEPWLVRKASAVIAISGAVGRHLQRRGPLGNVTVVYNALDAGAFEAGASGTNVRPEWGFTNSQFLVGMAGQMVAWKNHGLFLRMADALSARLPEARFVMAGGNLFDRDSAYVDGLRRQMHELGLEGKVLLAGQRSDMPAVLNALDVLVHPADREPLGRVILEAMALGRPVVAVAAAGPAEIITDGVDGVLVAPGDARALAGAVLGLRRDPARAAALGAAARLRVRSGFSPAAHVSEIETLYKRLLPGRPVVAMVVAGFPSLSETFILREMQALEQQGLRILPFALKRPAGGPVHAGAAPFLGRVRRTSITGLVTGPLYFLLTAPARSVSLLGQILLRGDPESGSRVKGLHQWAVAADWARAARARRVGRVHAQFAYVTADVGKLMATLLGVPFSLSAHAWDLFTRPPEALRARVAGAAFVAVCTRQGWEGVKARAPDYPQDRLVLVRHGVFPGQYPAATPSAPRLLAVGRLEEKKGFRHLVEACRLLKARGVAFDCVIAGEGAQRAGLERQIAAEGLSGCVRLAGALTQEQLMDVYGTAMIFAAPSVELAGGDRDGVPNVILEAMAAGLPVVASAAGAIPEAVTDGVQGVLVPPGDPEALAGALEKLLGDPQARRRMGESGRATVCREFDAARNAEALAGLFRMD
jgi:glycosyltransferase involved in cell wall biosynthesis